MYNKHSNHKHNNMYIDNYSFIEKLKNYSLCICLNSLYLNVFLYLDVFRYLDVYLCLNLYLYLNVHLYLNVYLYLNVSKASTTQINTFY